MINLREECEGYYKIEAVKSDGSRRLLADWFPNLILNSGLDRMGDSPDYLNYCQVGSGSTAPAETQTSLASLVSATSNLQSQTNANSGSSPFFARATTTFRFPAGSATGVLAEVGVGWGASGDLFSRALILDALGTATTITVLADEALDVTYELRMYAWTDTAAGTIEIPGSGTHGVVQKSSAAGSWGLESPRRDAGAQLSTLGYTGDVSVDISETPLGDLISVASISATEYTPGSYRRNLNLTAELEQWNSPEGVGSISINAGWGSWQIGFTPNIMKTASDILTLQVRHSWGRKA